MFRKMRKSIVLRLGITFFKRLRQPSYTSFMAPRTQRDATTPHSRPSAVPRSRRAPSGLLNTCNSWKPQLLTHSRRARRTPNLAKTTLREKLSRIHDVPGWSRRRPAVGASGDGERVRGDGWGCVGRQGSVLGIWEWWRTFVVWNVWAMKNH